MPGPWCSASGAIRAVLLGTEFTFITGVDLALMGVILFLLTVLTLRQQ